MSVLRAGMWKSAIELQEIFAEEQLQFCFIGGIAVQRWGQPRVTTDLDVTLITGFGTESGFIRILLEHFSERVEHAAEFALHSRVLLLEDHRGTPIDVALGALPFEEHVVARSTLWGTPRTGKIRTCSAEDLMVMKAFANRPRDWEDLQTILIRQGNRVDQELIFKELTPLAELKEEPEILNRLKKLIEETATE